MGSKKIKNSEVVIGIDFDNTIINYDKIIYKIAREKEFIPINYPCDKRIIKNAIMALPQGDLKWQNIQAKIYGKRINEAHLAQGVLEFINKCKDHQIPVYVISHKTKFSNLLPGSKNFQKAAIQWMGKNIFYPKSALKPRNIYFEITRKEKVKRIEQLGCTHFIDDLKEVFQEPEFPQRVKKILYAPYKEVKNFSHNDIILMNTWWDIHEYFFS